ncbi:outer membrane protein TOM13-domain-containing protein [Terfezia claveryi]|nr:outer membrane protein TOM13-domain-containing protein [Terfezia claveryi]
MSLSSTASPTAASTVGPPPAKDFPLPPHDADTQSTASSSSSSSTTTTTASPLILYRPPTAMSILRTAAINLVLPFINGLMLGFGELFAHEMAFRLGWSSTRVFPIGRRTVGPGLGGRGVRAMAAAEEYAQREADRKGRAGDAELRHTASLE